MKKYNLHPKQKSKKVSIAPTNPENDVTEKTKSRFLRQKPRFSA